MMNKKEVQDRLKEFEEEDKVILAKIKKLKEEAKEEEKEAVIKVVEDIARMALDLGIPLAETNNLLNGSEKDVLKLREMVMTKISQRNKEISNITDLEQHKKSLEN